VVPWEREMPAGRLSRPEMAIPAVKRAQNTASPLEHRATTEAAGSRHVEPVAQEACCRPVTAAGIVTELDASKPPWFGEQGMDFVR
jgi:hypothetical protein